MGEGSGDGPSPARPRPAARTFPTHRAAPEEHFNAGCTAGPHSLRRRPATVPYTPPRELVCRRLRPPPRPATGVPGRRGGGAGPGEETGACQTEAVDHGHPSPSSRRGGTTLAPRRPSFHVKHELSTCPAIPLVLPSHIFGGRTHSRRSPPGGSLPPAGFVVASSATRRPPQRPAGRQPFRAVGAPRPAISAAASRYATAPAEAGS